MNRIFSRKNIADEATEAAAAEMARYCQQHPRSPTAVQHPRLMRRGGSWIALLGSSLEDGIAGLGNTVHASLRAFDTQYRNTRKPRR